ETSEATRFDPGDVVDVVGFAEVGPYAPILREASVRRLGHGDPPAPVPVTAEEALDGAYHAQLVRITASLLEESSDSSRHVLTVQAGPRTFAAVLPRRQDESALHAFARGSLLQLTGVCTVQVSDSEPARGTSAPRIESFRLLPRGPEDVVVLAAAPWW